jgi:hypothetical protein
MTTISPGSISRTNSAPTMSRAQVSELSAQPSSDPAQHQRAHAQRIAHADQLGAGHRDDGKRAFDPAQRVLHPLGDGFLQAPRHQVDDAFAVRGGLEDRAAFDQLAPQLVGIDDVAVMGDRRAAHGELAEEGLHVADLGRALGAGGGIAHMADADLARQRFHHRWRW